MTSLAEVARDFLRPVAWRGRTPAPEDLAGSLLFERNRRVKAPDGTKIAYDVHGKRGPWVVLIPGFVCPDNFWRYLLPDLAEDYRVIVLDLRGQGLSGYPRVPGRRGRNLSPDDFDFPKQVEDIRAVIDAEGVDEAVFIGHSMGGQLALEVYRLFRERVSAVIMLTAPFESPLRTFYGKDFHSVFHAARLGVQLLPRASVLVWRALLLANPALTHELAKLTRALGPEARLDDMATYYRHMAYLDPLVVLMMAESMRSHSAADVLPEISVPTLIVAGDQDMFTPMGVARVMYETIPKAEMAVIEGAGHGAVIEKPVEVNDVIRSFLDRHIQAAAEQTPSAAP
jgi:pimeloyl-ACP methyl ester carboxylesterase